MEAAASHGIDCYVFERPDLIDGAAAQSLIPVSHLARCAVEL